MAGRNTVARANVEITGDNSDLKRAVRESRRDVRSFGKAVTTNVTGSLNKAAKAAEGVQATISKLFIPAAVITAVAGMADQFLRAFQETERFREELDKAVNTANNDLADALGRTVEGMDRLRAANEQFAQQQRELEDNIGVLRALGDAVLGWSDAYDTVAEKAEKVAEAQNRIARINTQIFRAEREAREAAQRDELAAIEEKKQAELAAIEEAEKKRMEVEAEREARILAQIQREQQARLQSIRATFDAIQGANAEALGLDRILTEIETVGQRIEQAITRRGR
jgi:uncharacterized phage infection (PIP) family protein YhgE